MAQRTRIHIFMILTLMMTVWLPFISPDQLVHAGGGILLRPPFNGTHRVTSYFDHQNPNYVGDNFIWVYNGERVQASLANHTGEPYPYDGHDGWDWSMGAGTDILAAAAGTVVLSRDNWGCYGHTIIIDHGNSYYTQYSHLSQRLVNVENQVAAGQHIGESGNTVGAGCQAIGAHLHFGVRHGGFDDDLYAIDPFGWRGAQRDPLLDYNNKESSCLWSGLPGDVISCADIIVEDDGAAGWVQNPGPNDGDCANSITNWSRCDRGNGFRYHWTHVWDPAMYWVRWTPPLRYRGYYQMHAFIPAENATTTNAQYQVHRTNGTITQTVNQGALDDAWASLDSHLLDPGNYVQLYDRTGEPSNSQHVAADAMKFSASVTHLPTVQNSGGRVSSIVIRNPSSVAPVDVMLRYYNTGGGFVGDQSVTIAADGAAIQTPPNNFSGSAVVVADGDVAIVVRDREGDDVGEYNGVVSTGGFPGWEQTGVTLYAPIVKHSRYGRSSRLYITNAGAADTTITVELYRADGTVAASPSSNVAVNGQWNLAFASYCADPNGCRWPVKISSNNSQPLAAIALERDDAVTPNRHRSMYNAFSAGATTLNLPLITANNSGWYTGIAVQNLGAAQTDITVTYFPAPGYPARDAETVRNAPANTTAMLVQSGGQWGATRWVGSAQVSANQPMAAVVNQTDGVNLSSYTSFAGGSSLAILPSVLNNVGGWTSSVRVRNLDNAIADVVVRVNGAQVWNGMVAANQIVTFYPLPGIGAGAQGSAIIECTNGRRIVAIVNTVKTGGDMGTYNGVNR